LKTEVIDIHTEYPELDQIIRCAKLIREGGLVIFPTETVYGLGTNGENDAAMRRLRSVKQRSEGKPFSYLISQKSLISNYTNSTNPLIYKLINAFWPGPLTLVVPDKHNPEGTIGVRMPDHIVALKLIQETQCRVAAPSANVEGDNPPRTCEEALAKLDGQVDIALDAGSVRIGIGSSVVDVTTNKPQILREGAISQKDIEAVARKKNILFVCTGNSCRSVMAEYLLKDFLRDRNDVDVSSAGTGVFIQSTASADTMQVLKEEGIDASQHISSPISTILLKKADLIFVMTQGHRQQVLERVPEVEKRVYLLREFANISVSSPMDFDVPDPIGRSYQEYKACLISIKEAVLRLVELI